MYRSQLSRNYWPSDLFAQFDRLQQQLQGTFDVSPGIRSGIRGWARGSYPSLNVGTTPQAVEVYCFAPGVDPKAIEVQIEKGVLSITGERVAEVPTDKDKQSTMHVDERFSGKFRRVVTLPDDATADGVTAQYRDGVLHVSVPRRKPAEPRRISVQ